MVQPRSNRVGTRTAGVVYENEDALPRAMLIGRYKVVTPARAILDSVGVLGDPVGMEQLGQTTFLDHDPQGPTLYGADIMVHLSDQHHGIAHALTDQARFLVQEERLWRMVGASRLPGYGKHASTMNIEQYVDTVLNGKLFDPVLSIHMKDGWTAVKPIHGYLQHDEDSVGWAVVIQWVNPDCPPPPEFDLRTWAPNPPGVGGPAPSTAPGSAGSHCRPSRHSR